MFKKIPILVQIYLMIFVVLIFPLLILFSHNIRSVMDYFEEDITRSTQEQLFSAYQLNRSLLQGINTEVISLAKNGILIEASKVTSFYPTFQNSGDFGKLKSLEKLLSQICYGNPLLDSVYIYFKDRDFLVTSSQGICYRKNFDDDPIIQSSIDNFSYSGQWVPRQIKQDTGEGKAVLSYVYPLTSITTSARGVVVVNLSETKLTDTLNNARDKSGGEVYILDQAFNVLTHTEKYPFMSNLSFSALAQNVAMQLEEEGRFFVKKDGEKLLYIYKIDKGKNWIYIGEYSFASLSNKIIRLTRTSSWQIIFVFSIGLFITLFVLTKVSKPLKLLIQDVKRRSNLVIHSQGNDLNFLSQAFKQITKQEDELKSLLEQKNQDIKEWILLELLKGRKEGVQQENQKLLKSSLFPYDRFSVSLLQINQYNQFVSRYTPEQRYFYRLLICQKFEEKIKQHFVATTGKAVIYENNLVALVINSQVSDILSFQQGLIQAYKEIITDLAQQLEIFVVVGMGNFYMELGQLSHSLYEAELVLKQRFLKGEEVVLIGDGKQNFTNSYYYPYAVEKHILNFMQTYNGEAIDLEINLLVKQLREMDALSYDNILQINNQLISATIKYLVENNISLKETVGDVSLIYQAVSNFNTIEDMEKGLLDFYAQILSYLTSNQSQGAIEYIHKITAYIARNYKQDIVFEEMAEQIGISYSYIRKIIKEETGKNLMEYINFLRISECKKMLLSTQKPLTDIAVEVGYNNVQSLTRFFKKFEGITPGEYRSLYK